VTIPGSLPSRDIRRSARHLELQDKPPEHVPNRALCAFVKLVAAVPWCAGPVMLTCFALVPFRC